MFENAADLYPPLPTGHTFSKRFLSDASKRLNWRTWPIPGQSAQPCATPKMACLKQCARRPRRRWRGRAAGRKGDPAAKMYSSGGRVRRAAPSRVPGRPGPALPPLRRAASWRWSKRPFSRRYSPPPRSQRVRTAGSIPQAKMVWAKMLEPKLKICLGFLGLPNKLMIILLLSLLSAFRGRCLGEKQTSSVSYIQRWFLIGKGPGLLWVSKGQDKSLLTNVCFLASKYLKKSR